MLPSLYINILTSDTGVAWLPDPEPKRLICSKGRHFVACSFQWNHNSRLYIWHLKSPNVKWGIPKPCPCNYLPCGRGGVLLCFPSSFHSNKSMPRGSRAGPPPWDPPERSGSGYADALSSSEASAPLAASPALKTGSPLRGPGKLMFYV